MRRRPALFNGFWTTLDGKPLRRVTREELRELHRLWAKHRDFRERPAHSKEAS
jgi:hypothetical protein